MPSLNALVQRLDHLGRVEHFDRDGGGSIVRSIYCEPYTAHKRVVTALRGTVCPGVGKWWRARPHNDPLYPWFYCQDVQVEPMFPGAARAARAMSFDNTFPLDPALGQFYPIRAALDRVDDYDGAELIDNLTVAEIKAGRANYPDPVDAQTLNTGEPPVPIGTFLSKGACGAKITATYVPLIFQPGLGSGSDPFDYVDPQWEPVTVSTQIGRNLFIMDKALIGGFGLFNGLSDSYAVPEVVWRFSIRRLMVPFLPARTIGLLTNKVNSGLFTVGSLVCPPGTVRMEAPEVFAHRAPDGQVFWDIKLNFLIRRLYDEYLDPINGPPPDFKVKGWVGWNWAYAVPHARGILTGMQVGKAGYYPVCWNSGLFMLFGTNHPAFLQDLDADMALCGGGIAALNGAPFLNGFKAGQ